MCLEEEAHRGGIIKHVDFLCMPSATVDGLCHLQVTEVLLIRASHVTMLGGLVQLFNVHPEGVSHQIHI